jgi:hypothetical protein
MNAGPGSVCTAPFGSCASKSCVRSESVSGNASIMLSHWTICFVMFSANSARVLAVCGTDKTAAQAKTAAHARRGSGNYYRSQDKSMKTGAKHCSSAKPSEMHSHALGQRDWRRTRPTPPARHATSPLAAGALTAPLQRARANSSGADRSGTCPAQRRHTQVSGQLFLQLFVPYQAAAPARTWS